MTMFLALAHFFGPGSAKMKLFETDEEDIKPLHGYLFPLPRLGSNGVRVKFECEQSELEEELVKI